MFNKMLVAIDGSEMSAKALDAAVHLAKEQQAELSILHVGREAVVATSSLTGIVYVPEHFIDEIRQEVKKKAYTSLRKRKRKRPRAAFKPTSFTHRESRHTKF